MSKKKKIEKIKEKKKNMESAIFKFTCLFVYYLFICIIWKEAKSIRMLEIWVGFSTSFLLIFIY